VLTLTRYPQHGTTCNNSIAFAVQSGCDKVANFWHWHFKGKRVNVSYLPSSSLSFPFPIFYPLLSISTPSMPFISSSAAHSHFRPTPALLALPLHFQYISHKSLLQTHTPSHTPLETLPFFIYLCPASPYRLAMWSHLPKSVANHRTGCLTPSTELFIDVYRKRPPYKERVRWDTLALSYFMYLCVYYSAYLQSWNGATHNVLTAHLL